MKPRLIHEDGHTEIIMPANGSDFTLKELYKYIQCDIVEVLPCKGKILIVDEEGRLKNKSINPYASLLTDSIHIIVGKAILCDNRYFK